MKWLAIWLVLLLQAAPAPPPPKGVITGYLRDSRGRPAPGIPVQLIRRAYAFNGQPSFEVSGTARTDDRGEYRVFSLAPGHYYLVAGQGAGRDDFGDETNVVVDRYPYTFFPGTNELASARVLQILAGTELEGVDLILSPAKTYRIRAQVIDPATEKAPAEALAMVGAWSPESGNRGLIARGDYYNPRTGTIEIPELPPGAYSLRVTTGEDRILAFMNISGLTPSPSLNVDFVVSAADMDLGVLRLRPPTVIKGRIRFEGATPSTPIDGWQKSLWIALLPPAEAAAWDEPGIRLLLEADGTFTANSQYKTLRVAAFELPPGFYAREARLDGNDALSVHAPLSGTGNMEIVLSSKAGSIDGVVRSERALPSSGAKVVLIPSAARNRLELFKEVDLDPAGRFSITGIAPGDYKVFAWEALEPYSYFDPEVLRQYEEQGRAVRIAESSRETLDISIIPAEGK